MTDKLTSVTIISQGGLDSTENHLILDSTLPGGASTLLNYEVGLYGGYRRINGYDYLDSNFPKVDETNAEGKILCLAIYTDINGNSTVIAARKQKSSSTYKFYYLNSSLGWIAYATGMTQNMTGSRGVEKIRNHKISIEGTSYIIFTDGVNRPIIFDGTTWSQPTGDQALDAPLYCTSFMNHVFFGGDAAWPNVVYHSAPEDPLTYTAAAGAGQLIAGYRVDGLKPFREDLYVFGNQRIKKVNVDGTTFVINDVATNIGVIAPDSIIEMDGDILFLAQDGVRTVSGTNKIGDVNLGSISRQVQQLINSFQDNYDLTFLDSTVIKKKSQFRYFISNGDISDVGTGLIGGIRLVNGSPSWEFSELLGIRTSCVENDYINNEETTLHGDYDGSVYIQETGNSFAGTDITSVYATPFLTCGDVLTRKLLRKINTFIRPEGALTLNITPTIDWNNKNRIQSYSSSKSTDDVLVLYDDPSKLWDDPSVIYDTIDNYPIFTTTATGTFNSLKITYSSSGADAPHTIQGFIIQFSPEGTRTL